MCNGGGSASTGARPRPASSAGSFQPVLQGTRSPQGNHSMGYAKRVHAFAAILITSVGLVAYVNTAAPRVDAASASPAPGSEPQETFSDPFAYCTALGTVDLPDSRYTGPQVPEVIARGLKKALGAPADAALEFFLNNTVWRCMDGMVYACTVGANLPRQEQADTSRKPTQEITD